MTTEGSWQVTIAAVEPDSSVVDSDRLELGKFVRALVSNPEFRELYQSDPAAAIRQSGAELSPLVVDALIRNVQAGLGLTAHMDAVASVYFYFFYAAEFFGGEVYAESPGSVSA